MKTYAEDNLRLRPAKEEDAPVILNFILELAEFEGARDQIRSTEEGLRDVLFERHITDALIAELDGTPIGFAIWAYSFHVYGETHSLSRRSLCTGTLSRPGDRQQDLFAYRRNRI